MAWSASSSSAATEDEPSLESPTMTKASMPDQKSVPTLRVASLQPVGSSPRHRESFSFGRRFSSSWFGWGTHPVSTQPDPTSPTGSANKFPGHAAWNLNRITSTSPSNSQSLNLSAMTVAPVVQEASQSSHAAPEPRGRRRSTTTGGRAPRPSPRGERILMGQIDMH